MNEQVLDDIKKLIDEGKLGEIPEIKGNLLDLATDLVNDKEKFSVLLAMLSVFSEGKYIRLFGEFAKTSIEHKLKRKAYLPNIVLDILFFLEMISYLEVKETSIVIKILDDEVANELAIIKSKLAKSKPETVSVEEYYKTLDEFKKFKEKYSE